MDNREKSIKQDRFFKKFKKTEYHLDFSWKKEKAKVIDTTEWMMDITSDLKDENIKQD